MPDLPTRRLATEREARTCLLLGAGASAGSDFKLPVMTNFFRQSDLDRRPELHDLLKTLFPNVSQSQYNLEDVLGFLDLSRHRAKAWGPVGAVDHGLLERCYDETLALVSERLAIPDGGVCSAHQKLAEQLGRQDSVVSLNYDLIADRALAGLRVTEQNAFPHDRVEKVSSLLGDATMWGITPPSLTVQEQSGGFLLKLHGSLDWLSCPNLICTRSSFVHSPSKGAGNQQGQMAGDPCRACGTGLATVLIPPVARKRIEEHSRLSVLWSLALRELTQATTWVLIGLSLAPTDFELRWLLQQAYYLRAKKPLDLDVVNPNQDAFDRAIQYVPVPRSAVRRYQLLSDYVSRGHADLAGHR